jgi:N-ethylmaleimide reductase
LAPLGLAYLNIAHQGDEELLAALRRLWPAALLLNRAGADIGRRAQDIEDGIADVITVGRLVLANPDLVERVRAGAPLNEPDPATFYSGGERGYTDYPALAPRV